MTGLLYPIGMLHRSKITLETVCFDKLDKMKNCPENIENHCTQSYDDSFAWAQIKVRLFLCNYFNFLYRSAAVIPQTVMQSSTKPQNLKRKKNWLTSYRRLKLEEPKYKNGNKNLKKKAFAKKSIKNNRMKLNKPSVERHYTNDNASQCGRELQVKTGKMFLCLLLLRFFLLYNKCN